MKFIPIRKDDANFSTLVILRQVVTVSPNSALNIDQIRKRCKILDIFDAVKDTDTEIKMEDAEHETLKQAVQNFPFQLANPALLRIIDDVLEAATPPKPK